MDYHKPVLLNKSVEGLNIRSNGVYVDLTYGGGGHSKAILNKLKNGRLIAFDQDEDVLNNLIDDEKLEFYLANFRFFHRFVKYAGYEQVDGILADLGVSAHHFNDAKRGFSYRFDAKIDMRMNKNIEKDAVDIINTYSQDELRRLLREYGEINNAGKIAAGIVTKRIKQKIITVNQLVNCISEYLPENKQYKFLSKIFQAIRMEVNNELDALKEMLIHGLEMLKPGGRFVVISYHSLEDKCVKNFFKTGTCSGEIKRDNIYGNVQTSFKLINKKVIVPEEEEIKKNKSARSAKLRIAEKI